jgi:hypothetical protein
LLATVGPEPAWYTVLREGSIELSLKLSLMVIEATAEEGSNAKTAERQSVVFDKRKEKKPLPHPRAAGT